MRLLPCGDAAVLVEYAGVEEVLAHHGALVANPADGVLDLVPAERTLLIRVDPRRASVDSVQRWATSVRPVEAAAGEADTVELPVRYDGPDLRDTADLLGWSVEALAGRHAATTWRAAFVGFAPGFAYLMPDAAWPDVPRRPEPRTRVPAGSIGLAAGYCGVYPTDSPGGWQLIGRTDVDVWQLDRDPPALLTAGTVVRFVERR